MSGVRNGQAFLLGAAVAGTAAAALTSTARARAWGRVNRTVIDYTEYWKQSNASNLALPETIRYLALGDSCAQGVGASHVDLGYVPRVARALQRLTGRTVEITNLSVSGAQAHEVLRDQIPQVEALGWVPDLVTLDVGGNDVVMGQVNADEYTTNMRQILRRLPERSYVGDVPWFAMIPFKGRSEAFTERVRPLIPESGHVLLPLHEISASPGPLKYHLWTAADFFHPNDAAYLAWSEAFIETIVDDGWLARLANQR